MAMAAQLGCTKLIYIHRLTPLLRLVLHFLDWPSTMSKNIMKMTLTKIERIPNNKTEEEFFFLDL
jgi:hypothetical protein